MLLFTVVIISYHNVIVCFWTSHYIMSFIIDIIPSQVDTPKFYFFLHSFEFGKHCTNFSPSLIALQRTHSRTEHLGPSHHLSPYIPAQSPENQGACPLGKGQGLTWWAVTPASYVWKITETSAGSYIQELWKLREIEPQLSLQCE